MAVSARALGRPHARRDALPRRHTARVRSRQRQRAVNIALAVILSAFLVALFYLVQTIHVAAANYELDRLLVERDRLTRELQSLRGEVVRWGAEPAVVTRAGQSGLSRLGEPLRLAADR